LRHVPYGNDPRQRLDVYLPQDRRVASTIVFFYGGGWVSGARWYYRLLGKALAKRGHIVIIPDYRLFPQVRFPDFNQDAALALSWANQNLLRLGGHPSRLFLMGHSAGAHIAATLALDPRYLASHSMVPGQIAGVIGLAGPYTLNPLKWQGVREIFSPSADEPQAARPIKLVRAGAPPMLLLHGARDRLVGAHASVLMSEALLRAGSHASAEIYKGLGHTGILTSLMPGLRWRSPALKHAEAFLARPAGPLPDDRS
jgi:acetyl esterase/lipase